MTVSPVAIPGVQPSQITNAGLSGMTSKRLPRWKGQSPSSTGFIVNSKFNHQKTYIENAGHGGVSLQSSTGRGDTNNLVVQHWGGRDRMISGAPWSNSLT